MEIRPILSAMLRNKTGAILIALQIALTLAIVCNAVFIIHGRLVMMDRPTGIDTHNIFVVSMTAYRPDYNAANMIRTDLDVLRRIPGVVDAAYTGSAPLSGSGSTDGISTKPDPKAPTVEEGEYYMDDHALKTLGVHLVEGRDFTHEEVVHTGWHEYTPPPVAIISRALATRLFPGQDALGKTFYEAGGRYPVTVIGVVDTLTNSYPSWHNYALTAIFPAALENKFSDFMVRTLPGQRDEVMKEVDGQLAKTHTGAYVRHLRTLDWYVANTFQADHALTVLLTVMICLILAITALGIVGLASFSVSQRTRQIGTRRALGARKTDIVRYFMMENWLITSIGVALGSVFAVALNFWLVNLFDVAPISWYYIPVGIVCLWVLGLLAVLSPALRAAAIPPAIATRNV